MSWAQVLKKDLNANSFTEKAKFYGPETFLQHLRQYYKPTPNITCSIQFHQNMFTEPVKMVFYWCQDDWQGELFIVYEYMSYYIYATGSFGSCSICDGYPETIQEQESLFRDLQIASTKEKINIHKPIGEEYTNPDLIKQFLEFSVFNE